MTQIQMLLLAILVVVMAGCDQPPSASNDRRSSDVSNGMRLQNHMQVLAADDMQGREAGTDGYRKAAAYVASKFAELELQAFAEFPDFYQPIEFLESQLQAGSSSFVLHDTSDDVVLADGADFVAFAGYGDSEETITAPLVFAGFGIQAPGYSHDDFSGIDARGKILVLLSGAPPTFAANERAYYSSGTNKLTTAASLGALGTIVVRTPADQQRIPWTRMVESSARAGMRWVDQTGNIRDGFESLPVGAAMSNEAALTLFRMAGADLNDVFERHDRGETGSFDLGIDATLSRVSGHQKTTSSNVIGLIPGSDPKLKDEYVLVTAHLDHLGAQDGKIFNGFYDNAAGVATILEIAAAMTKSDRGPRRSVIIAALTAEEKGLRGSDYLAEYPPVPIDQIVANINIDMPYLGYPLQDVVGFGVEHTSLRDALTRAAQSQGLSVTPDSRPELVRLIRSDQYSFVKKGVPGLNLKPGMRSADPSLDAAALRSEFLIQHYHQESDTAELPFDARGAGQFFAVALELCLIVANDESRPTWNDGDFFAKKFATGAR